MRLADRHFLLEKGRTHWQGSSQDLLASRHDLRESLGV